MAQGIALEAMGLIREWLPVAYRESGNLAARAHMMAASTMGATAFQKGLGAMHSLSHPCGAVLNTHHGLTNAVVMPYVLVFNRPAITDKMTALARYLNLAEPSFHAVLDWILHLREELGIPSQLADLGVEEEYVERLARMAAADPSSATNPVPLTVENLEQLYLNAINGIVETA
jgi:alcohol dehydrogenase class IV